MSTLLKVLVLEEIFFVAFVFHHEIYFKYTESDETETKHLTINDNKEWVEPVIDFNKTVDFIY